MLSLCPLCPEKPRPPGEQTDSITLPLNWGSPASLRRHYHLVNTRCIGFPGKPRSSVPGVWKSKPNPRPTHPSHSGAQGPLSFTQAAPSWSLPQCMVTFSSRASPACSVGLWLARTPHSAQEQGTLPVPGAVVVTPERGLLRWQGSGWVFQTQSHICQTLNCFSSGLRAAG